MKLEKTNQFKVVEIYFAKIIINNKLSQVVQDVDKAFFLSLFFPLFNVFNLLISFKCCRILVKPDIRSDKSVLVLDKK